MAVRASHGLHAPPGTETGSVRKLAALRQRTLLYPFQSLATRRHLTGIHVKSSVNGNFNCNFNCNCRCAGNVNCNCRCAYAPVATGRAGSAHHSLHEPGYSAAPGKPAISSARRL
jgi:hypothetical protein